MWVYEMLKNVFSHDVQSSVILTYRELELLKVVEVFFNVRMTYIL